MSKTKSTKQKPSKKKASVKPLTFTGSPCFIPGGTWDKAVVPIYNPNDSRKRVRILYTSAINGGLPVQSQDVFVNPHSYATFNGAAIYAIVEQFDN